MDGSFTRKKRKLGKLLLCTCFGAHGRNEIGKCLKILMVQANTHFKWHGVKNLLYMRPYNDTIFFF